MKKDLLTKCRFYKGEPECPTKFINSRASLFWESEKLWVDNGGDARHSSIIFLVNCGLSDEDMQLARKPADFLDIPLGLRAIMFELLCRYSDVDPRDKASFFLNTVLPEYMNSSSINTANDIRSPSGEKIFTR